MSEPRYRPFNTKEISWRTSYGDLVEVVFSSGVPVQFTRLRKGLACMPSAYEAAGASARPIAYRLL